MILGISVPKACTHSPYSVGNWRETGAHQPPAFRAGVFSGAVCGHKNAGVEIEESINRQIEQQTD